MQTGTEVRHGNSKNLLINDPATSTSAQTNRAPINPTTMVVEFPDVDARFPGGLSEMNNFINETVKYPQDALKNGISGKVYISMEINVYGLISKAKISRSVHPSLDREALRIVREMPQWIPAQANKRAVRSRVQIPITFRLSDVKDREEPEAGFNMMLGPP